MQKLDKIAQLIEQEIAQVQLPQAPSGLYEPIRYILSLGGKRIRPSLLLMVGELYGKQLQPMIPVALGFEIFHNFTLLHDDLMDKADKRRGHQTVHKKWNDNTAVLSGDVMLVVAYKQIAQAPAAYMPCILNLFSQTAAEICEGQQYDMEFESRQDVAIEEYLEMIRLKTAVLLGASLKAGAILSDASAEDCELLYDLGINLGLAFQIQDDLLDVYGNSAIFGKKIGGDILCNKKTFVLLKAQNMATKEQRKRLDRWMNDCDIDNEAKITNVTALYNEIGVKPACEKVMDTYYQVALEKLEKVSLPSERKEALFRLAEYLMHRNS